MFAAVGVIVVVLLAVVAIIATAQRRATTGRLGRETRTRDVSGGSTVPSLPAPRHATAVELLSREARVRADAARRSIGSESPVPAPVRSREITKWEPVEAEEIGVTRRQFFNRSIFIGLGLGLGAFGVAALGFLWPSTSGGFGGKVQIGSLDDIQAAFANKIPYYNAAAKAYIVAYPSADISKAKKISAYTAPIIAGMAEGYVALYQKCPHLGCRVPWCPTSQWFECPCHGSKYNRVGEKRGGPAPRGMDRFPFTISGGAMVVDTGAVVLGPPIGTDTTGQAPEGAPCV